MKISKKSLVATVFVAPLTVILVVVLTISQIDLARAQDTGTLGTGVPGTGSSVSSADFPAAYVVDSIPVALISDYSTPTNANVLCVYNASSTISKGVCDYYRMKRPGSNVLAVHIPENAYVPCAYYGKDCRERMLDYNFARYVSQPIKDFVANHTNLNITHLAIAKDIPIGIYKFTAPTKYESISANIFLQFNAGSNTTYDDIYWGLQSNLIDRSCIRSNTRFDPRSCVPNAKGLKYSYAVSYLSGQTLDDIKMFIDKAQMTPPNIDSVAWVLDLGATVSNGYDFPDAEATQARLMNLGIKNIRINLTDNVPLTIDQEMIAYGGRGSWHAGYGSWWVSRDPKVLGPVASRAIIDAYESYFGGTNMTDDKLPLGDQGKISQSFRHNAFGGTNYSRSFSGGVGTIDEPGGTGLVLFRNIFPAYASGKTFAESFLAASKNSPVGIAIGDPLMRLYDSKPNLIPISNNPPTITLSDKTIAFPLDVSGPLSFNITGTVRDDGVPTGSKIVLRWQPGSAIVISNTQATVENKAGIDIPISATVTFSPQNPLLQKYQLESQKMSLRDYMIKYQTNDFGLRLVASDQAKSSYKDINITVDLQNLEQNYFTADLKVGDDSNIRVAGLQSLLMAEGFDIAPLSNGMAIKGYFGPATSIALARFQRSVGLTATGKMDTATVQYLNNCITDCDKAVNAPIKILAPRVGETVIAGFPYAIAWTAQLSGKDTFTISEQNSASKNDIVKNLTEEQARCFGYKKAICFYSWTPTSISPSSGSAIIINKYSGVGGPHQMGVSRTFFIKSPRIYSGQFDGSLDSQKMVLPPPPVQPGVSQVVPSLLPSYSPRPSVTPLYSPGVLYYPKYTPIYTPAYSSSPTPTYYSQPTYVPASTYVPTYSPSPTPAYYPASTYSPASTYIPTYSPSPTPAQTYTPYSTYIPASTYTPTYYSTPSPTPSPTPTPYSSPRADSRNNSNRQSIFGLILSSFARPWINLAGVLFGGY